jgi:hypothetical protein
MSEAARRPRGWRVRIAILWAGVAVIGAVAGAMLLSYGARIVEINQAYLDSDLRESDFEAINQQWVVADLLQRTATPLLVAAALLIVLTLAVQARGWQLTRERARARRADPLAP